PSACLAAQTTPLTVDAAKTLDFTLPQRRDSFGYFCNVVASSYVAADAVLALTGDDDSVAVTLPFPFTLYGKTYTTANVATNGNLNFLAPSTAFTNTAIPDPGEPNAAVYGFWDDLFIDADGSVRTQTVGTAPNRQFIVEWR